MIVSQQQHHAHAHACAHACMCMLQAACTRTAICKWNSACACEASPRDWLRGIGRMSLRARLRRRIRTVSCIGWFRRSAPNASDASRHRMAIVIGCQPQRRDLLLLLLLTCCVLGRIVWMSVPGSCCPGYHAISPCDLHAICHESCAAIALQVGFGLSPR